jgi:hypothetical protein
LQIGVSLWFKAEMGRSMKLSFPSCFQIIGILTARSDGLAQFFQSLPRNLKDLERSLQPLPVKHLNLKSKRNYHMALPACPAISWPSKETKKTQTKPGTEPETNLFNGSEFWPHSLSNTDKKLPCGSSKVACGPVAFNQNYCG